jgi:hypothetical protein
MMRAAALCAWSAALGFGLPGLCGTWYLAAHDRLWIFLDFPTYGSGPLEDLGVETTTPLLVAFVLVCAAELVVGWMLWRRKRAAVAISLALLPLELAFWIGFALPVAVALGLARTALVLAAWSSGRRADTSLA